VDKVAMLSIILVTVAVPMACAGVRNPRRAVQLMALLLLLFNAVYITYVTMIHTAYFQPPPWPWPPPPPRLPDEP